MSEFDPNSVEWSEPPERQARRDYSALVDTLRSHPGQSAIVRHDAPTGNVTDLRNVPGVKVTSRPNGDGTSTVWARWVGVDEFGQTVLTAEEAAAKAQRQARADARKADKEAATV